MKKLLLLTLGIVPMIQASAQTTITAWNFDNLSAGANANPAPSTGTGSASALGMSNSYNNTNSISNPDIASASGSSSGGPNAWRVRGSGTAPNGGNGWSSQAPIGTQGAQFMAGTAGFNNIQVSFDIQTTAQAESKLELLYTTDGGTTWLNATLTSAGTTAGATILNNSSSPNTVMGSYLKLSGTAGWNNLITANLTGVSGVDDNALFGIQIVNAATGVDDLNVAGTAYNNTSGNWRYDNVTIGGSVVVPEPSTFALAGLGFATLLQFRRRKN